MLLTALPGIPEIERGADLGRVFVDACRAASIELLAGDVLVIAQKIVSKAEGRYVALTEVEPGARAVQLAAECDKDPRLVELILRESREVLRVKRGVLIVEHRLGHVMASAGIDRSNVPGNDERVLLLPEDPDASAKRLRERVRALCDVDVAVVINDSFGRAWRSGVTGTAIGLSGIPALVDLRGEPDREGRPLAVTQVAAADELAAAASLVMGQAAEGTPAVHVRGFPYARRESRSGELIRDRAEDLFR